MSNMSITEKSGMLAMTKGYHPSSNSMPASQDNPLEVWLFSILTMVVIILIIVGNTLVCIAVATDRSLRAVQNRFLVSLAISDLTVGVVIMPMGIVNQLLGYWVFGVVLCQLWKVCDVLACTASIWNLCLIAIDRYCCITRAVKYTAWRTPHRVNMMIIFVWALAIFISVPPLFGWRVEESPSEKFKCLISDNVGYILFSTMGSFYIPAVIMIITYANVWSAAKFRARSNSNARDNIVKCPDSGQPSTGTGFNYQRHIYLETNKCLDDKTSTGNIQVDFKNNGNEERQLTDRQLLKGCFSSESGDQIKCQVQSKGHGQEGDSYRQVNHSLTSQTTSQRSNGFPDVDRSKRRLAQKRERRATLVLGIIMGTFLACWYPFFQLYVISALCRLSCNIPTLLFDIIFWIGYCNSALNPIIYTVFNRDFRRAFAKIIKKIWFRSSL